MAPVTSTHLPITREECSKRGWNSVDIVLVTGDAYIDHPSFGTGLIGRLLESKGYRVAILPQPRYDRIDDFLRFGKPNLFFGISAGNLDSIVANYTGSGKVRDFDSYSKDGFPYFSQDKTKQNRRRPDRATIIYTNLAKSAYKDIPVILGGIEASLRRFIHYDYKQNRLRNSILTDSKADLLIYGMGEKAVIQAAEQLKEEKGLSSIPGSCERISDQKYSSCFNDKEEDIITLPSWQEIEKDNTLFMDAELTIDKQSRAYTNNTIVQGQKSGFILQHPPSPLLSTAELDELYNLPFTRSPHPNEGDIPAHRMIRHSITTIRGCCGNCSFCAITRHQGAVVTARSKGSIIKEAQVITQMDDFTGTISDLGGPTANLYGTDCAIGGCKKQDCLYPEICKHLQINEKSLISLLDSVASLQRVKHVFISSGLRMELLLKTPKLLKKILLSHTPGSLKIAPEHTEKHELSLMHKESFEILEKFIRTCRKIETKTNKRFHFTPYIITGHPGSTVKGSENLVKKMKSLHLSVQQFQDFTPTPGTISTAMLVTGLDRKKRTIHIPSSAEKVKQRKIIEKTFIKKKKSWRR